MISRQRGIICKTRLPCHHSLICCNLRKRNRRSERLLNSESIHLELKRRIVMLNTITTGQRLRTALLCIAMMSVGILATASAHPLGNFTINHFARIEPDVDRIRVHYVIDMAEIPAFQELQKINRNASPSNDELAAYAREFAAQLAANLSLIVEGQPLTLKVIESQAATQAGAGGLPTLRIECDLAATLQALATGATHRLRFE